MPQRRLLNQPDPMPDVTLPQGEGDDNMVNKALRAMMVGLGIEEQKPGDGPGAIGGLGGLLAPAVFAIPPKTAKEMSRLMVELMDAGPSKDAWKYFQERFPRVMGHVREIETNPNAGKHVPDGTNMGYMTKAGERNIHGPDDQGPYINYGSEGNYMKRSNDGSWTLGGGIDKESAIRINEAGQSPDELKNTVGHELAHAAQRIGLGNDFDRSYDFANHTQGYANNMFEESVRKIAQKHAPGTNYMASGDGLKPGEIAAIKSERKKPWTELPPEFTPVGEEPPYKRPTYPEPTSIGPRDGTGARGKGKEDNGLRRRKANGHQEGS